jgi:conjugative transfer pilus assembly protein TraH
VFEFKRIILITALLLMYSTLLSASVWDDFKTTCDKLGIDYYADAPHAFHASSRYGVSLGAFRLFSPVNPGKVQLVTFDPPSISAGCSGVSIIGGGFSFVDSDKLVEMLQGIMTSAAGYFFEVAIEQLLREQLMPL